MLHTGLPYIALQQILMHTCLIDVDNVVIALSITVGEALMAKQARKNPATILSLLTERPEDLLNVMKKRNVLLSGSHALEYFAPGSSAIRSSWDFYIRSQHKFSSAALSLGHWNDFTDMEADDWTPYNLEEGGFEDYIMSMGTVWKGGMAEWSDVFILEGELIVNCCAHSIRIIYVSDNEDMRDEHIILNHLIRSVPYVTINSSSRALQCFVSGSIAVHMYGKLTSNDKVIGQKNINAQRAASRCYKIRSIYDDDSIFVRHRHMTNDEEDTDVFTSFVWYEYTCGETDIIGIETAESYEYSLAKDGIE